MTVTTLTYAPPIRAEDYARAIALQDIAEQRAAGDADAIEAMADGLEEFPEAHEDGVEMARLEAIALRREAARLRSDIQA